MEPENQNQLNYALVESTRPPMYKAMKYWGKKPHNIWREFIECYCPENGFVLDPFMGSGVAAFESVIAGRKAIAFDINPMSAFFIEVTTCCFDEIKFKKAVDDIVSKVESDNVYKNHFCKQEDKINIIIYNYIWEKNNIIKINSKTIKKTNGKIIETEKAVKS